MQIPSVHDASMAPPGKHAASAYAYAYAFPVETPRDQHGHLKNEMAQRVIDKISRYAPNFKHIQIRHITFAPYQMNTMFGAPAGRLLPRADAPRFDGPEPAPRVSATCLSAFTGDISPAPAATAGQASRPSSDTTPPTRCSTTSRGPLESITVRVAQSPRRNAMITLDIYFDWRLGTLASYHPPDTQRQSSAATARPLRSYTTVAADTTTEGNSTCQILCLSAPTGCA